MTVICAFYRRVNIVLRMQARWWWCVHLVVVSASRTDCLVSDGIVCISWMCQHLVANLRRICKRWCKYQWHLRITDIWWLHDEWLRVMTEVWVKLSENRQKVSENQKKVQENVTHFHLASNVSHRWSVASHIWLRNMSGYTTIYKSYEYAVSGDAVCIL